MANTYSKNVIEMELLMATKGTKNFDNAIRKIPEIEAKTRRYNKILGEHNLSQVEADKVLGQAGMRIDQNGDVVNRAGMINRNYNKSIRENTGALGKFNMEQLGVMFGGMALDRAMTNLNATSREWLGMGELTSTMMGVTMLSANMDLLEYGVLPLFDALTNLPEGAQKAIGYTTIALEGLGGAMMVGGQLMLGLDSTSTMLAKIAGISPNLVFTTKGLSAMKKNLAPVMTNLKTASKIAGTGIAIAFAIEDLKEGDMPGFIADLAMGVGFMTGNPWAIGVGISFKLATEGYLGKIAVDFFDTIGYMAEWGSDTLSKALSLRSEDIDWSGITGFFDEMDEYAAQKVLSGEAKSAALINRMKGVQGSFDTLTAAQSDKIKELQDKYDSGIIPSQEILNEKIRETQDEYGIINTVSLPKMQEHYDSIEERGKGVLENLADIALKIASFGTIRSSKAFMEDIIGNKAVGGNIHKTGAYYLHEGEQVIPKTGVASGQVSVNATYNVTVSDKREFEQMLKKNNENLTAQVRRMVKV